MTKAERREKARKKVKKFPKHGNENDYKKRIKNTKIDDKFPNS